MNRHRLIMKHMCATKARPSFLKTDADTLRDHHQFIREDGGFVSDEAPWGERLAARYYGKLVKEYAVCELSGYKDGRVGLRWRTEQEVVVGKGQFECGSLACGAMQDLQSYEVPFKYVEQDERKQVRRRCVFCFERSWCDMNRMAGMPTLWFHDFCCTTSFQRTAHLRALTGSKRAACRRSSKCGCAIGVRRSCTTTKRSSSRSSTSCCKMRWPPRETAPGVRCSFR